MAEVRNPFTYTPQYVYEHHVFVGNGLPKPIIPPCIDDHKAIKATTTSSSIVIITYDDGCQQTRILGTKSWRNNNPGNIEVKKHESNGRFGSIGHNGEFEIYPDENTGFKAISLLLKTSSYQKKTLQEAIYSWAPPKENDTVVYSQHIQTWTDIPLDTKLNILNDQQFTKIAEAIRQQEGWRAGRIQWKKQGN